ncbi:hypothetical protein CPLU01_13845 [Colletotrichum plurivorum]|uniref:Uncharacterized protein n=1 Tax=Colletotrichum plurivorum TaxID=2175906 RepID=A0A8H6JNY3_9PEZI|nr:hypothetical protein CPLU01_13845 [Colletotrichum plurivorum]
MLLSAFQMWRSDKSEQCISQVFIATFSDLATPQLSVSAILPAIAILAFAALGAVASSSAAEAEIWISSDCDNHITFDGLFTDTVKEALRRINAWCNTASAALTSFDDERVKSVTKMILGENDLDERKAQALDRINAIGGLAGRMSPLPSQISIKLWWTVAREWDVTIYCELANILKHDAIRNEWTDPAQVFKWNSNDMIVKALHPKSGYLMLTAAQRADEPHRDEMYDRRPEYIAFSAGYLKVLTRLEYGGGLRPADAIEKVKTYDRPALQKLVNELNARDGKQILEDKYINHMDALRAFEDIFLHEEGNLSDGIEGTGPRTS